MNYDHNNNLMRKKILLNKIKSPKDFVQFRKAKTVEGNVKIKNHVLFNDTKKNGKEKIKNLSRTYQTIDDHRLNGSKKNKKKKIHYNNLINYPKKTNLPLEATTYSDEDNFISEKIEKETEEKIKYIKDKILNKYKDLFETYNNAIKVLISTNEELKVELNRETIYTFLKMSYKYADYNYSLACAILLLIDRLNNPDIELNDNEKEGLENIFRSYSYHTILSYKYAFKAYHHDDKETNNNNGPTNNYNDNHNHNHNNNHNHNHNNNHNHNQNHNNNHNNNNNNNNNCITLQVKKNICKSIRHKIKNQFLLNSEAIINLINCIFYTIKEERNKFFYTYLNANQYKIISDMTETGVKYKYEQLAERTFKRALDLGMVYLKPTDINFLNLASSYIYFLYFNLGYEQKALNICIDIFDKSTNILDEIEDKDHAHKCLEILSKMRHNIKRWSKKLNKNSILFLTF
ncbi:14-3-3 protein, putative [Plasmodium sp. gorilla clade G3]|nr:14-3-3 protein, putative [Plasmodium sp. gorilla clade G3]